MNEYKFMHQVWRERHGNDSYKEYALPSTYISHYLLRTKSGDVIFLEKGYYVIAAKEKGGFDKTKLSTVFHHPSTQQECDKLCDEIEELIKYQNLRATLFSEKQK
jgi:RNA-binding protein YlmH